MCSYNLQEVNYHFVSHSKLERLSYLQMTLLYVVVGVDESFVAVCSRDDGDLRQCQCLTQVL